MRVVSLLPSATETLCVIGSSGRCAPGGRRGVDLLVGRSHECDWPPEIANLSVLTAQTLRLDSLAPGEVDAAVATAARTGTDLYRVNADLLRRLSPDIILTQDLCRVCSIDLGTVRRIAADLPRPAKIVSLNPASVEDVLDDVLRVGREVGLEVEAGQALQALRDRIFDAAELVTPYLDGPRTVVLEWTDPLFVGGHWTPQLVERAGGSHPLNPTEPLPGAGAGEGGHMAHRAAGPSRRVSPDELIACAPEAIIIAPCGVALPEAIVQARALAASPWWSDLPAVRAGRIAVVDGSQMFNRPGPRLVDAFEWLVGWLNDRPEVIPEGFPWTRFDG